MNQTMRKARRQERILSSLNELNFATRKQLQVIERLGGDRNAHRVLYEMEQDKLISSIRREQKVYYLSNKGKGRVGSDKNELGRDKIDHFLLRNDLFIKLGMPSDWRNEVTIKINDEIIKCDAMYKLRGEYQFIEIDNKQKMRTNEDKIKRYKELSHLIFKQYNHTPTLIWYSLSDIRKNKLKNVCEKAGVKHLIY